MTTLIPDRRMTEDEFERWSFSHEGPKCELVEGRIVQHTATTKRHARIVMNIAAELRTRLDRRVWAVMAETVAVKPPGRTRLPDLVIERVDAEGSALAAMSPVLLAEVLSPTSVVTDLVEKAMEYRSLPTLHAYVVASQEAAICWTWQRDDAGRFPELPLKHDGIDAALLLSCFGIEVPLAAIYDGIGVI